MHYLLVQDISYHLISLQTLQTTTNCDNFSSKLRQFLLEKVRVLVIGAGGLGCELLKDLALVGFTRIDVIDMDTIDYSNLNRQFLFRTADVKSPKAEVAAAFVNKRVAGVKVKAHYSKIEDKPDTFYQKFHIIVAGLDSIPARRWINETLCNLAGKVKHPETGEDTDEWDKTTVIPLVDGGTEGFMGQSRVIWPHITPCFECLLHLFPPDPLNFQECTLVATPRQPQHCISWAMQFAWKDDPEKKDIEINGDNPAHIKWLFEKASERAADCKIEGVTLKLTQGVVKRIIPAIASTNAIIAASCANEAFKIATSCSHHLKNWMLYNGTESVYTSTTKYSKNEDCLVCSMTGTSIHCDPYQTLQQFLDMLIADKDTFLCVTDPSITKMKGSNGEKSFLHMTGILKRQTVANLQKTMWELCEEGDTLLVTNRSNGGSVARERMYMIKLIWKKT